MSNVSFNLAKELDGVAALLDGKLSDPQASAIAEAAIADPNAERDLIAIAQRQNLAGLRDKCRDVIAAAAGDEDASERIRIGSLYSLTSRTVPALVGLWRSTLRGWRVWSAVSCDSDVAKGRVDSTPSQARDRHRLRRARAERLALDRRPDRDRRGPATRLSATPAARGEATPASLICRIS